MYPGDATNPEALNRVLKLGLLTAGGGAALRSLLGMRDMFAKSNTPRRPAARPAVVEVSVPEVVEEDSPEELTARAPSLGTKLAEGIYVPPNMTEATDANPGIAEQAKNFLLGRKNVDIWSKPWVPLAATTAAIGGGLAGYKGIDALLDRMHTRDKTRELEDAKEEYRKALLEQYTPDSTAIKRAEASELGKDLDELYDLVKSASTTNDVLGTAVGGYLPLAALLAGGTGMATYNWVKSRSPEERLVKAIKQRERLRWAARPPEIYAVSKQRPVRMAQEPAEVEYSPATPEDEADVRKVAAQVAALYKP